jgi:hypothetical protein
MIDKRLFVVMKARKGVTNATKCLESSCGSAYFFLAAHGVSKQAHIPAAFYHLFLN